MKKILSVLSILTLASVCLFASFDGRSSVGINYSYDDVNYFGLTTDSVGYSTTSPVGYYIGTDADFKIGDITFWTINMILGPSYRYTFGESGVTFEVALGLSANGNSASLFSFGVGSYTGVSYSINENLDLLMGVKMGSNFVNIPLNNPSVTLDGDFYVTPNFALGFKY